MKQAPLRTNSILKKKNSPRDESKPRKSIRIADETFGKNQDLIQHLEPKTSKELLRQVKPAMSSKVSSMGASFKKYKAARVLSDSESEEDKKPVLKVQESNKPSIMRQNSSRSPRSQMVR